MTKHYKFSIFVLTLLLESLMFLFLGSNYWIYLMTTMGILKLNCQTRRKRRMFPLVSLILKKLIFHFFQIVCFRFWKRTVNANVDMNWSQQNANFILFIFPSVPALLVTECPTFVTEKTSPCIRNEYLPLYRNVAIATRFFLLLFLSKNFLL